MKNLILITILLTLSPLLAGCWESKTENAAEDVVEKVEDTADEAGDDIQDAADNIKNELD